VGVTMPGLRPNRLCLRERTAGGRMIGWLLALTLLPFTLLGAMLTACVYTSR
jgi:hypothetical protein